MTFEENLLQLLNKALEPLQQEIADLKNQIKVKNYPPVITVKEAKEILKIGTTKMYELTHHPNFPAIRTSDSSKAHIKIPTEPFLKWINENPDLIA